MNNRENYSRIVVYGSKEDREKLIKLSQTRAQKTHIKGLTKVQIRSLLLRNFMDCIIFNERNKKTYHILKNSDAEYLMDNSYLGLRTAIFYLGLDFKQIDKIAETCRQMAHKYYPDTNDMVLFKKFRNMRLTKLWSTSLIRGQKFRWFEGYSVAVFTFDKIENNTLFCFQSNGNPFSWIHYNPIIVYIMDTGAN